MTYLVLITAAILGSFTGKFIYKKTQTVPLKVKS